MGGLANNGASLHHWLAPQRWGALQGLTNAGLNYMPISAGFNSWMNGTTALRSAAEWGFKAAVLATEAAPATAAARKGGNCP